MMEVLRCQDRWGREIVLTTERWYGKILRKHREMTENAIRQAPIDPDQVNLDKSLAAVEVFSREVVLPAPHGRSLVKVCVRFARDEYEGVEVGKIISAYTTFNMNDLEECKWSRDGHCP